MDVLPRVQQVVNKQPQSYLEEETKVNAKFVRISSNADVQVQFGPAALPLAFPHSAVLIFLPTFKMCSLQVWRMMEMILLSCCLAPHTPLWPQLSCANIFRPHQAAAEPTVLVAYRENLGIDLNMWYGSLPTVVVRHSIPDIFTVW